MNFIEPWLPSLAIFLGFLLLRIIFRSVIFKFLRIFASKLPFNTNEDIVDAADHPLQFLILILGLYFALLASPLSYIAYYAVIQELVRSSILITVFWTLFNLATTTHNLLVTMLSFLGIQLEESLANIVSAFLRFFIGAIALAMIVSEWGYDINDLDVLYKLFYDQYWQAADVGEEYAEGYQNRAINTYNYVTDLDLSQYA